MFRETLSANIYMDMKSFELVSLLSDLKPAKLEEKNDIIEHFHCNLASKFC